MNLKEILLGIVFVVVSFVFIAQTVSFEFAKNIFIICAIIGLVAIIDGLRRE